MKLSEMYPSNYLGKDDVPVPIVLSMDWVSLEDIKSERGKEQKPVLHFCEEQSKDMILNKTNAEEIAAIYGEDSDRWHGKPIEIWLDPSIMFAGKRCGGLRVRKPS